MQFQVIFRLLVLSVTLMSAKSAPPYPHSGLCAECEEEVWEEVPCDEVYASSSSTEAPITTTPTSQPLTTTLSPTTTPTPPESTTDPPTTIISTTTPAYSPPIYKKPYSITSNASPPKYSSPVLSTTPPPEASDTYKKCYCDCKSGCKEFCRQVVTHPDGKKQITQLSKTRQPVPYGHIETKHLHERNFVPEPSLYNPPSQNLYHGNQIPDFVYLENKPAYKPASQPISQVYTPSYGSSNYQQHNDVDSLGYSIEELTRLLNIDAPYPNVLSGHTQPSYNQHSSHLLPSLPEKVSYYSPITNIVESVDAQTASTGGGTASAVASASDKYKASRSNGYEDAAPAPYEEQEPSAAHDEYPQHYDSGSSSPNSIPDIDSTLENYLRSILYSHPPRIREYGYSL